MEVTMKKFVYKYRISKFRRFTAGLLFAIISATALILCYTVTFDKTNSHLIISLIFSIAIVSMLMGLISMFRKEQMPKRKYKEADL